MKDFLIRRWIYEWMLEFLKPEADQEKLQQIESILECMDPLKADARLEKGVFYCEHIKRRRVLRNSRRKRYLSVAVKTAVFVLLFIISAQAICYAITGKSIFRYIDQMNRDTTEVQIEINDPNIETPFESLVETIKAFIERTMSKDNGAEEGKNYRISTWKEVKESYKQDIIYPRYIPNGWELQEILVNVLDDEVVVIIAYYSKGEDVLYYSYYDHSGTENGSKKILFGEKKKKIKEIQIPNGEFSFYKGEETLSVLGHIYRFETNVEGMISVEEAEKIVKSIE